MKLAEGLQNVKQKISFGAFNRHVLEKIHFLNSIFSMIGFVIGFGVY